jgi:succinylarginine dihydrolase
MGTNRAAGTALPHHMPVANKTVELNLDGLVGPTHHYGGLGVGNLASQRHRHEVANPRAAALEGIAKMRLLVDLGIPQGVLPPQERPLVPALRQIGFAGDDAAVLAAAAREAPELLSAAASTSSMWAANAATISPSADTADGRLHLTPANLVSQWHRSLETAATAAVLRQIFRASEHFCQHDPLPAAVGFADEGAANHTRLSPNHGSSGIELFTYGREADEHSTSRFPARQSLAASQAIARLHGLAADRTVFLRQSAAAIEAGVFHNDVIAVGNENLLLVHEQAYADGPAAIAVVKACYRTACGEELTVIEVSEREIPLAIAVETYLFNSQMLSLPGGGMALICPAECRAHPAVSDWLDGLIAGDNPVTAVHPVAVGQSMRNGGGPACLRLRLAVTPAQLAAVHQPVLMTPERLNGLETWVQTHYRDRLAVSDLADPFLLKESRQALEQLGSLLELERPDWAMK